MCVGCRVCVWDVERVCRRWFVCVGCEAYVWDIERVCGRWGVCLDVRRVCGMSTWDVGRVCELCAKNVLKHVKERYECEVIWTDLAIF